ncbi:MAG: GrpB family protein [Acidimicrobiales bacterium]
MVGVPDSTVAVVPYSDDRLRLFEEERTELAEALGASAMSIEHIGSTAVPGLAAKPTIDILLVTDDPQRVLEHPLNSKASATTGASTTRSWEDTTTSSSARSWVASEVTISTC